MLVVADSGPPHYLVLIGVIDVLPKLFGRVVLPEIVRDELRHTRMPYVVRRWMADTPAWIEFAATPALGDVSSPNLGAGERAAIALALSRRSSLDGRSPGRRGRIGRRPTGYRDHWRA